MNVTAKELSFNWDIHLDCNYKCPYCWFNGKWEEVKIKNVYPAYEVVVRGWKRIYENYGTVKIAVTGGEPLIYPKFAEFIAEMSKYHKFMIISNLSSDIEPFILAGGKNSVIINPSFHPLAAEVDSFIKKALRLKDAGMLQCVTYLAWPPLIKKYAYYQEIFTRHGLSLTIQSFFGEFEGRKYPDSYSEDDKKVICPQLGKRGDKPFQTEAFNPKGRACNAGRYYGVIGPDGNVRRCGGSNSADALVGNIFKTDFRLLQAPSACMSDVCPCNEWAFLLEEQ